MMFHAKALELYTKCFQSLNDIDPVKDVEVGTEFLCYFSFFFSFNQLIILGEDLSSASRMLV